MLTGEIYARSDVPNAWDRCSDEVGIIRCGNSNWVLVMLAGQLARF